MTEYGSTALLATVVPDVAPRLESCGHGSRRSGEETPDAEGDRGAADRERRRRHVRIAGRHHAHAVRGSDEVWPVHDRVESCAEYGHSGAYASGATHT